MSSTGTRKKRSVNEKANESIIESDKELINQFKIFAEASNSVAGLAGPAANNSPKTPAGNYLAREGDSMIGPLALGPPLNFRIEVDADNTIDIGPLGENIQYTSNIQLDDLQPNSSILDIVANANFDGQVLVLRTFAPTVPYTIRQATLANGGNIQTGDGNDITLGDLAMVILVFDESLIVHANTGGTWRVLATAGGAGTGTNISADLTADQITNLAVNQHIEFDRNAAPTGKDGGIVLQTGAGQADGIFELIGGKTYFMSAAINPLFSGANNVEFVWYDITNATELGRRSHFDDASLQQNQPKNEIIITPATDITVEVRIAAVTAPANFTGIASDYTFASIFEFSGVNSGGGGGSNVSSWKLPVRVATIENGTLASDFENGDVIDGVTLATDDRILIKNQTTASENGIYTVNASGAPTRATDFDTNDEVISESFTAVEEGDTQRDTVWHLITNNPITVGTTNQLWREFGINIPGAAGSDGKDASGVFILDGRQGIVTDKLKRWERIDEVDLPDGILHKLLYLPFVVANSFPNVDEGGRLVALGLNNANVGAQNISGSFSDNWGDSWTECIGLQGGFRYELAAYDPVGDVVVTANTATGSTTAIHTIKRSTDRAVNFVNTANIRTVSFTDLIWVAGTINLFILTVFNGGTTSIMTSPDGNTWTDRTTPSDFWTFLAYQEDTGTIYAFDNNANNFITSTNGTTWSTSQTATTPPTSLFGANRIIWSVGQQVFGAVRTNGEFWSSPDADVWTNDSTLPNVNAIRNLAWAPDFSLWIAIGENSVAASNLPIFWWSNDRVNWVQGPNAWRESGNVRIGTTSNNADLVYVEEYNYFVGIGRANNQSTNISARCYRTDVEFNNVI